MSLEQQEYELAMNEVDQLVRAYSNWDWVQDELARFAAAAPPEVLRRAGGQLPRLGIMADGLLGPRRLVQRHRAPYRRKAPFPNELRHLILLRIVKLSYLSLCSSKHFSPKHVYTLFDSEGIERPERERVRHAIRKVLSRLS